MSLWIGNAVGSAIGLVAILLGALWNASLTRTRDKSIMDQEAKSIASAIGAEMAVYAQLLTGRVSQAYMGPDGRSRALLDSLRQPAPMIWPKVAAQIGKLNYELSYRTVMAWALLDAHASSLSVTVTEMQDGQWNEEKVRSRLDALKLDIPAICATIGELTGREPPDLQYALP